MYKLKITHRKNLARRAKVSQLLGFRNTLVLHVSCPISITKQIGRIATSNLLIYSTQICAHVANCNQQTSTCSKSIIETPEKEVKCIQN